MRDYGSVVSVMQYLTKKQVAKRLGISVSTVEAWSADGVRLPEPVILGTRSPRWDLGTLELHIERLSRQRRRVNHTPGKASDNGES